MKPTRTACAIQESFTIARCASFGSFKCAEWQLAGRIAKGRSPGSSRLTHPSRLASRARSSRTQPPLLASATARVDDAKVFKASFGAGPAEQVLGDVKLSSRLRGREKAFGVAAVIEAW